MTEITTDYALDARAGVRSAAAQGTLADLIAAHGVEVLDYLDRDMEIPILAGLQRQGDTIVIPDATATALTPVPASGTSVVRGENGGNTHAIFADGPGVYVDVYEPHPTRLLVARVTVDPGSTAYQGHPEHGFLGIAPGNYRINRQREQADEVRVVAD